MITTNSAMHDIPLPGLAALTSSLEQLLAWKGMGMIP